MRFSIISIFLSFLTVIFAIKINLDILHDYLYVDGKTRALFGLTELKYFYKYYFLTIPVIALLFLIFAFKNQEFNIFKYSATFLVLISILSVFLNFWKWFI